MIFDKLLHGRASSPRLRDILIIAAEQPILKMNQADSDTFLLPQKVDAERLARQLGGAERCLIDDTVNFSLTFHDSFDWRLHGAGLRLLRIETPQGGMLRLKPSGGGEPLDAVEYDAIPAWPAELPDGPLRDKVTAALEMRVLLAVVSVRCHATELRVLNEDAKTVVRLQLMHLRCTSPDVDEPRSLWPRVRLLPVRGYEEELARLAAHFANDLEWPAASDFLFDEAVAAVWREAGDYSSKLDIPLKPQQMAIDAMRKVLLTLLDTLERNIDGARANLDSEFLHDLRVATRRTRSALSQVKRVLPDSVVEEFKPRFGWLGQVTGPTRDLDVFLLELPRYRASLPAAMAGDLDALESHLRLLHEKEQAKLRRKLGSAEMRSLVADWRALLEADSLPGEPGWFADLPVERVASQRIWRMYKKVLKAGRAVSADGPPEEMHALRKDCKKLRYLIEFFRGLYPAGDTKGIIRALKDLLDNLGEFQDLEVQADELRDFARQFPPDDPRRLATVMAIGALVADLLRRQQAAHERFAGCFAAFDSADNRADYKRLFKAEDA